MIENTLQKIVDSKIKGIEITREDIFDTDSEDIVQDILRRQKISIDDFLSTKASKTDIKKAVNDSSEIKNFLKKTDRIIIDEIVNSIWCDVCWSKEEYKREKENEIKHSREKSILESAKSKINKAKLTEPEKRSLGIRI